MSDVENVEKLTPEQVALVNELRTKYADEVLADGLIRKYAVATIGTVLGQNIPPVDFAYTWLEYTTVESAKASDDWLSDKQIREVVNDNQSRNGLSSARAIIVNQHASRIRETPEFKRSEFIKAAVAFGMTQEQAEQLAASKL